MKTPLKQSENNKYEHKYVMWSLTKLTLRWCQQSSGIDVANVARRVAVQWKNPLKASLPCPQEPAESIPHLTALSAHDLAAHACACIVVTSLQDNYSKTLCLFLISDVRATWPAYFFPFSCSPSQHFAKSPFCVFRHTFETLSFLYPNVFHITLSSNALNPCSSCHAESRDSHRSVLWVSTAARREKPVATVATAFVAVTAMPCGDVLGESHRWVTRRNLNLAEIINVALKVSMWETKFYTRAKSNG
jgi:hypothetical protein